MRFIVIFSIISLAVSDCLADEPRVRVSLERGWNLISFPVLPEDPSVQSIFGSNVGGAVWRLQGQQLQRVQAFETGVGYWVFALNPVEVDFTAAANQPLPGAIEDEWNLLGAQQRVILEQPAWEYHTTRARFFRTSQLEPGKGYYLYAPAESFSRGDIGADGDSDGAPDYWEAAWQFDLNDDSDGLDDPDSDNLDNAGEFAAGSNPRDADSDDDGLGDRAEADAGTSPNRADTDGDGYDDVIEVQRGTATDATQLPLTTLTSSPADGEGGVAVTRETIIYFSNPLAEGAVITAQILNAKFGAQDLAARIQLSADRRKVTLFYDSLLPASAQIRVSIDGTAVHDDLGFAVDADRDNTEGGQTTIDFNTLSLTLVDGTAVCGRVFASELTSARNGGGEVNNPLEGVVITVDGIDETELSATTDEFGNFRLEPAPAGRFFVHIDGRQAAAPEAGAYYPFVGKAWVSVPGEETNVGDVYLPLVADGTLQQVNTGQDEVIHFAPAVLAELGPEFDDVSITVPDGSLINDDGSDGTMVGIAPVDPARLPGTLPPGLDFPLVITVQSDAPNFDTPASICFPNLEGLDPGEKTALWSFNHDTGRFEMVGAMTVNVGGTLVCTDPGVGILAPGWHSWQAGTTVFDGQIADEPPPPEKRKARTNAMPEAKKDECPCTATCRVNVGTKNTVLLHSGEEYLQRTDLMIPGRGDIHFRLHRTYRSRLDYDGPLGFGWTLEYDEGVFEEENGDVTRVDTTGYITTWTRNGDGSYTAPPGQLRVLIKENDFFVLRDADGFKRYYDSDGRLSRYEDRNHNIMLFDYDSRGNLRRVIDPFGREIDFVFATAPDGGERLTRVRDFTGREVVYSYDTNGDLISVRTPVVTGTPHGNDFPDGRTERYTYSSGFEHPDLNHNLLSVTSPEEVATGGPPSMQWTYGTEPGAVDFDRVISETVGGTNASGVAAGGTMTIGYEMLNEAVPLGDPSVLRGKATVTERNGNVWEYYVNELQQHIMERRLTRGLRQGEPAHYETRNEFNADHLLIRQIHPEGNSEEFVYDSAGNRWQQQNVLEERLVADGTRGGGEDLVTSYTYEPLYNQIASITDPRGNAQAFTPPIGVASQERYTTFFTYDYQEGNGPVAEATRFGIDLSGVTRDLGDVNADGVTDQETGNLIRRQDPTVQLRAASNEAARTGSSQQVVTDFQWNDRGQKTAEIDPEGNITVFDYYPENDPDGDATATGATYLPQTGAPRGYRRSITVDAAQTARRTAAADPVALLTTFFYDEVGNVTGERDPRGILHTTVYNALNEPIIQTRGADVSQAGDQLITGETAVAFVSRFHYDHNGRLVHTEVENRDQTTPGVGNFVDTLVVYDILNNPVEESREIDDSNNAVTQYRYDGDEQLIETILPEGNRIVRTVDERNLVHTVTSGAGAGEAATTTYDYDLNGNPVRIHDAQDNDGDQNPEVTTFAYDGFDRQTLTSDALGNETRTTYDVASNVVTVAVYGHPAGQPQSAIVRLSETIDHHDELNRVYQSDEVLFLADGFVPQRPEDLQDEDDNGHVTRFFEFDANSRRTFVTEDDGETTTTVYDGADRPLQHIDAMGNHRVNTYDQNGNIIRVTTVEKSALVDDETYVSHRVYDQLDRLVRTTDNMGQTVRYSYDSRDNRVFESDGSGPTIDDPLNLFTEGQINDHGNVKRWQFDGLDRRTATIRELRDNGLGDGAIDTSNPANADGLITLTYEYDRNSRLTGIVDDNGRRTVHAYDALNRKITQTNADGKTWAYTYDRDNNLLTTTDPNGTVATATYDVLNRVVQRDIVPVAGVGGTTQETYAYDGLSRLTQCTDNNGGDAQTCSYVYDSLSRVIEEVQNGKAVSTVYSGDSRRLSCTYPGGRTLTQEFDDIDRITRISDGGSMIYEADWIGPQYRDLNTRFGNGTRRTVLNDAGDTVIGYDALKRPTKRRAFDVDQALFLDRQYTYNRANKRDSETRGIDNVSDQYAYDSSYRVTSSDYDQGAAPAVTPRDLERETFAYDGVGNRVEVNSTTGSGTQTDAVAANNVNEYTQVGTAQRVHSDNGNLRDDANQLYKYDYRNRLIEVRQKSDNALLAEYRYFCDNRRAVKIVAGVETHFYYDGQRVCEERNTADQTTITYVYGPTYIDHVVQLEQTADHPLGAGEFYLHQNTRADVVAVSNASGRAVERLVYNAFGDAELRDAAGAALPAPVSGNPYRFQGRRFDDESGLYYFRNRMYSADTGRFLQRDKVWDANNVGNQYSFAGNNGISSVDPHGHKSDDSLGISIEGYDSIEAFDKYASSTRRGYDESVKNWRHIHERILQKLRDAQGSKDVDKYRMQAKISKNNLRSALQRRQRQIWLIRSARRELKDVLVRRQVRKVVDRVVLREVRRRAKRLEFNSDMGAAAIFCPQGKMDSPAQKAEREAIEAEREAQEEEEEAEKPGKAAEDTDIDSAADDLAPTVVIC